MAASPQHDLTVSVCSPASDAGLVLGLAVDGERAVAVGGQWQSLFMYSEDGVTFREGRRHPKGLRGAFLRGDDVWVAGEYGYVSRSTDRGKTWQRLRTGTDGCLFGIVADDEGNLWTAGDDGYVAVSADGVTFRRVKGIGESIARISNSPLGVLVPTDDPGYLYRCAAKSRAAGRKADQLDRTAVAAGVDLMSATVTPAGTLVVVGDRGAVYRSTDGGGQFDQVPVDARGLLAAVDCLADGRVVVVGAGGLILVSGDDGRTFAPVDHYASRGMFWCCRRYGDAMLIGGEDGLVVRLGDVGAPTRTFRAATVPVETVVIPVSEPARDKENVGPDALPAAWVAPAESTARQVWEPPAPPPVEVRDGVFVTPELRAMLYPRRGGIATAIRPLPTVDEAWAALRRALWAADRTRMERDEELSGIWERATSPDERRRKLGERILDPEPRVGTPDEDAALVSLAFERYTTFIAAFEDQVHDSLADFLVASVGLPEAARRCLVGLDDELPYVGVGPFGRLRELLVLADDEAYAAARTAILETSNAERASANGRRKADLGWATTFLLPLGPEAGDEERQAHDQALKYTGVFGNHRVHACGLAAGDLASLERFLRANKRVRWEFFAPSSRLYLASVLEMAGSGAVATLAGMKPADPFDDDPGYNTLWCRLLAHIDDDTALEALHRERQAGGKSVTWGTTALVYAAQISADRVRRLADRTGDAELAALVERERLQPEPGSVASPGGVPDFGHLAAPVAYQPPPAIRPAMLRSAVPVEPEATWRDEEAAHAQQQNVYESATTWDGVPLARCSDEQLDAFVAHRERWAIPTSVPDIALAPRRLHDRLLALGSGDDEYWFRFALPLVMHRHGLTHLPLLLAALDSPNAVEAALTAAQPFGDVAIVPAVSRAFAGKKHKALARSWILRHPRHAAAGALAMWTADRGDAAARMLRYLDGQGHRPTILEYAATMSAADDVTRLLDEDPLAAPKVKLPTLPDFAAPATLPPLVAPDGVAAPADDVELLLIQLAFSNADEVHPRVPAARTRYTAASRSAFAWALFEAWLAAGASPKLGWCMQAVGFLGDDDCARKLTALARKWPGEGASARAQAALDTLRNIGTDTALVNINLLAEKSRYPAFKAAARERINAIADARGLTADELADRLVPTLGLDESGGDVIDTGACTFRVVFDRELLPVLKDQNGKLLPELPRPGRTDDKQAAKEAKAKLAALRKDARASASLHVSRMERAMCSGRRIAAGVFGGRFVRHPWMSHLARRLVWGAFEGDKLQATFRVAEDATLADAEDELFTLPEHMSAGILHALEFPDGALAAWSEIFADYEILQPFVQLGRPVYPVEDSERDARQLGRLRGRKVGYPALRGLETRGWVRWYDAAVQMAKPLGAGVTAVLVTDPGWHPSETEIEPQTVEGLQLAGGTDTFGTLPAVVFSELMHDLHTLAES